MPSSPPRCRAYRGSSSCRSPWVCWARRRREPKRWSPEVKNRSLRADGNRFVAYGFNDGVDKRAGTLNYFDHPGDRRWRAIRKDLDEARRIGANTLRVSLEIGQFMNSAKRPRPRALDALERLLRPPSEWGSAST